MNHFQHEKLQRRRADARPYQIRLGRKLDENWQSGLNSQLIVAPTGAGKSYMALAAGRRYVNEVAPARYGCRPEEVGVFWMAMRHNLLIQTDRANREFYDDPNEEVFCPNLHYVSSFSRVPDRGNYKVRLLISDEAHHSSTTSEATVTEAINPTDVIGLSATPERHDRAHLTFQTTLRDAGYRTLIKEGWLSPFRHFSMERWSPKDAALAYLQDPARFGKSLFFFRTMEECTECQAVLAAWGVEADIVHGGADRKACLGAFQYGDRKALISMSILSEGFDAPELESVFVRDTMSPTAAIQMAGRVLRPHAPTPVKNIIQSSGCAHPFLREASPVEQYLQRGNRWVSLLPSERAKLLMEEVNRRISKALKLPPLPDWDAVAASINSVKHTKRGGEE